MNHSELHALRCLARQYGVLVRYRDGFYKQREVSPEALLAVLHELGAPVQSAQDAPAAQRQRRRELWEQLVDPVVVVWDDEPQASCLLRLPAASAPGTIRCDLELECGENRVLYHEAAELSPRRRVEIEGSAFITRILPLPADLPLGYHCLRLEYGARLTESLLIVAPRRCFSPNGGSTLRNWGVFLPLYALQTARSWGAGDLTDLDDLTTWVRELGGAAVGTLPLLTAFLDFPFDPSPYGPASRLFWNEFYLDPSCAPEFSASPAARELLRSAAWGVEIEELRRAPFVDARRLMALKRRVLEELARTLVSHHSERQAELFSYVEDHAVLDKYAQFRATVETRRQVWYEWPEPLRSGFLRSGDFDPFAHTYHLYVQWLATQQLAELSRKARDGGAGLYLDLPLGVHPDGFDVWDDPESFALGVAGGAPPDRFFTKGQNWGFSPLNPEQTRRNGHQHWIACLRHHLQYAGILRIDHFMGLHRLYWIPKGMEAGEGAYVQYPAEELYAIVSLESHRHQAVIVGEDLGTVPDYIRWNMRDHDLRGMYVTQFELDPDPEKGMHPAPARSLAGMNTHDTATFAAFWDAADIDDQIALGLLRAEEAENDRLYRQSVKDALVIYLRQRGWLAEGDVSADDVLRGCLLELAASPAEFVLVSLEDLWGERLPQNTPGTVEERPNWRRKAAHSFEEFRQMPEVVNILRHIDEIRRGEPQS